MLPKKESARTVAFPRYDKEVHNDVEKAAR